MSTLLFSTFEVTTQSFYRASLSYAIVNLKPIVPGRKTVTWALATRLRAFIDFALALPDVLVIPNRPVPRLTDLNNDELACLMHSVKRVGSVVEKAYGADGLTIACQDGKAAGQTVPHVHFHLMPRKFRGDPFGDNNDEIYPVLERNEASLKDDIKATLDRTRTIHVDADESRVARSLKEMEQEADWLRTFFETPH